MKYKIINRKKLYATMLADIIGNLLFLPKRLLTKKEEIIPDAIKEILVVRTAYTGDAMMTVPMLRPLKERFVNARLSFLTSTGAGELLRGSPYIDEIITYDPFWFYNSAKGDYMEFISGLKRKSFDLVIEARGDIRELLLIVYPLKARFRVSYGFGGGSYVLTHCVPYREMKHRIEYHLDLARSIGCKTENAEWGIYLSAEEKKKAADVLESHGIRKPFISVHAGGRLPLKRWITDRYALLYDKLKEKYDLPIVMLGSKEEQGQAAEITNKMKHTPFLMAGKLTIRELAAVLSESALFVCNDSAPMHIAAAMKTPTVAIFGPSKSIETAPYGNAHRVVEKDFPCRYACDESSCRFSRYHACMGDIEVNDVLHAVKDLFEETRT
ncbi:MAG: glycosyltransferase family 9 protein [Nitrospirae bacterium]|nr:glycosyltransferase family 9 protein [Nitrospirota bacterium]